MIEWKSSPSTRVGTLDTQGLHDPWRYDAAREFVDTGGRQALWPPARPKRVAAGPQAEPGRLEGKRGQVRAKPPLPAISGLFGKPTIINNVITLASVAAGLTVPSDCSARVGSTALQEPSAFWTRCAAAATL